MALLQYIDTAAPELQLIECALYAISSKQDRGGDIFIVLIKNPIQSQPYPSAESPDRDTGPKRHLVSDPQMGRKKDF